MSFNPVLPVTYSDASYLSGDELQSDLAVLIGNDIDLNSRINSIAGGYNQVDLEFTGASLSYSGSTYVSGKPVFLTASAVTVTGAAGWRYVVCTDAGVISIETIPGGEITANNQQYTPEPIYNSTYNGYYSSVNTAKRIIGICYFDATNILECIGYGSGKAKNDDWYHSSNGGLAATSPERLQFTAAFEKTRGTNISIVDNGSGTSDSSGFRVTAESSGYIIIDFGLTISSPGGTNSVVSCNKNGAAWMGNVGQINNGTAQSIGTTTRVHIETYVSKSDYFTVYVSVGATNVYYDGMEIKFRKNV